MLKTVFDTPRVWKKVKTLQSGKTHMHVQYLATTRIV